MGLQSRYSILRRVSRWTFRVLLVFALTLFFVLGLILLPQTRVLILEAVLTRLGPDITVDVSGVKSSSLGSWYFPRFKIDLRDEPWIEGRELKLNFSVGDLLDKKLNVQAVSVEYLRWQQPAEGLNPNNTERQKDVVENTGQTGLSSWLIKVDALEVKQLDLNLSALGVPQSVQQTAFSISADTIIFDEAVPLKLNFILQGLDNSLTASVKTQIDKQNEISIQGSIQEKSAGLLGALLRFPADQDLFLDFGLNLHQYDGGLALKIRHLKSYIGSTNLDLSASLKLAENYSELTIETATLLTNQNRHTAQGKLSREKIDITARLNGFPLDIVTPWLPELRGGSVSAEAHVYGATVKPAIDASISGELGMQHGDWSPVLQLDSAFAFDWKTLSLHKLELQDQKGSLAGLTANGEWKLQGEVIDVQLQAKKIGLPILNYISRYIPGLPQDFQLQEIKNIVAEAKGSTANQFRDLYFDVKANPSGIYKGSSFSSILDVGGTSHLLNIHKLVVELDEAKLVAKGDLDMQGAKTALHAEVQQLPLTMLRDFGVTLPENLDGTINATADLRNSLTDIEVNFDIHSELGYVLTTPEALQVREQMRLVASGAWHKSHLKLDELDLQLVRDKTTLVPLLQATADIDTRDKRVAITASTQAFPMALLTNYGWPDKNGVLSLNLNINSSLTEIASDRWLEQLGAQGHLHYETEGIDRKTGKPGQLGFKVDLGSEVETDSKTSMWVANLSMQRGDQSSRNLKIQSRSSAIAAFIEDRSKMPSTQIQGEIDFSFFNFLLPKTQHISGLMQSDVRLDGELTRPNINGSLSLVDGTLIQDRYGLRLQNIQMDAEFQGKQISLTSLTANDMGRGKLKGSGYISWRDGREQGVVDLRLQTKNFETVRHQQVEGKADAELTLTGDFSRLVLAGEINLTPFSVSIAQNPGSDIPQLNYEFREEEGDQEAATVNAFPELILDLKIKVDKQAFVRGRGLEAELNGLVRLSGPADDLEYKGEFKTVRGQFNVMGRRFTLDRGEVRFSNNALAIYVRGLYEERDFKATAELRGTNNKFDIHLTSDPVLPEDELLARLIFGRSVKDITPLQAIQLAQAVKILRGDGGFDPVEKARDALNVDTFTVDTDETEAGQTVSLGAGKYINDKVYLELERSSDPANPWQGNVLIELTPHISLESSTGGNTGSSAEILWKFDY